MSFSFEIHLSFLRHADGFVITKPLTVRFEAGLRYLSYRLQIPNIYFIIHVN